MIDVIAKFFQGINHYKQFQHDYENDVCASFKTSDILECIHRIILTTPDNVSTGTDRNSRRRVWLYKG